MNLKISQQILCRAFEPDVSLREFELAEEIIHMTQHFTPADRIKVYQHSISGMHYRVMEMVFPVCLQILGDACFANLANDYLWSTHSRKCTLDQYGDHFPDWLDEQIDKHDTLKDFFYLPDLARLEWGWHQSLFTQDDAVFKLEDLTDLTNQHGTSLVPQLSHSLFLFNSPYPVYDIWLSHKNAEPKETYQPDLQHHYHIIYRMDTVEIKAVSDMVYRFIELCQTGLSLADMEQQYEKETFVGLYELPSMIQSGWVTGFIADHKKGQQV
ncbi:MAG: DNA-binding domain-containing protein [Gammaproteobacteria bacterium]|nr:DNA-binding domain-containing protein [Gammaproteobacteria bacterium]